uniref:Uncharacterized protein LOC104225030 n=1 Tax=Nicotiana sylvestris TaxID=4096 RepID=A0A1U7WLE6_NICSY|nr:PREDICTED: uncharacterized protein LOC104225030 [Nicotiana sylvestris]
MTVEALREELSGHSLQGGAKKLSIGDDGVVQLYGQICIPNIDGLRELILEEAHYSREDLHQRDYVFALGAWFYQFGSRYSVHIALLGRCSVRVGYTGGVSTIFHPCMDGQFERTIQILENMLRVCVNDYGGHWDRFLTLAEIAYNKRYQPNI